MPPYDDFPRFELAFPGPPRDTLVATVRSGAKTSTTVGGQRTALAERFRVVERPS